MSKHFASILLLAGIFALASTTLQADTITQGGVSYTFTAGEADGGGVFDEILSINTTGATVSGTLSSFSVQFTGASNVVLESVSSNAGSWSVLGEGPNTANGCNINGSGNHWCASGSTITITKGGAGDSIYNFVFDVTMPSGTAPTRSEIQTFQGQGNLAVSNGAGIGTAISEPSSGDLLGVGLLSLMAFILLRSKVAV